MKYLIFLSIITLAIACKKDHVAPYSGDDGIAFYVGEYELDSLTYSFAYAAVPKQKDTVFLRMRVLGAAAAHDRIVKVQAGTGSNARAGKDYLLPDFKVPAGALEILYPVVLLNSPEMTNQSFRLVVEVAANTDFVPGAIGREIGGTYSISQFRINVSNQLVQPTYWPEMMSAFGPFSITKFRFMVSVTGLTDFSYEAIGADGYYNLPVTLGAALQEYEAVNGPLIDENGNPVTF